LVRQNRANRRCIQPAAATEPEIAAFAPLGAIFLCRLMTNTPLPEKRVHGLIATVFGSNS
jgi:hypothetical protein